MSVTRDRAHDELKWADCRIPGSPTSIGPTVADASENNPDIVPASQRIQGSGRQFKTGIDTRSRSHPVRVYSPSSSKKLSRVALTRSSSAQPSLGAAAGSTKKRKLYRSLSIRKIATCSTYPLASSSTSSTLVRSAGKAQCRAGQGSQADAVVPLRNSSLTSNCQDQQAMLAPSPEDTTMEVGGPNFENSNVAQVTTQSSGRKEPPGTQSDVESSATLVNCSESLSLTEKSTTLELTEPMGNCGQHLPPSSPKGIDVRRLHGRSPDGNSMGKARIGNITPAANEARHRTNLRSVALESKAVKYLSKAKRLRCWKFDRKERKKYYISLKGIRYYGSEAHRQWELDNKLVEAKGTTSLFA